MYSNIDFKIGYWQIPVNEASDRNCNNNAKTYMFFLFKHLAMSQME